jgi:D-beta-D-heptose 7-phosphate kinase/D-beta-D-heptose 1-phosphate adenosyltransferase
VLQKILAREALANKLEPLKAAGKRIVFTNGCFDILHVGHVRYLKDAKNEGDVLIVGLNSDRSVRQIKGPTRPIVSEKERAEVLASLECVDFVTLFDEPDPLVTIEKLMPHILVKGADWEKQAIIGKDVVEANGGRVVRIPLAEGASTSRIIEKIVSTHCG